MVVHSDKGRARLQRQHDVIAEHGRGRRRAPAEKGGVGQQTTRRHDPVDARGRVRALQTSRGRVSLSLGQRPTPRDGQ